MFHFILVLVVSWHDSLIIHHTATTDTQLSSGFGASPVLSTTTRLLPLIQMRSCTNSLSWLTVCCSFIGIPDCFDRLPLDWNSTVLWKINNVISQLEIITVIQQESMYCIILFFFSFELLVFWKLNWYTVIHNHLWQD